jgi:hypothetical protein
VDDAKGGAAHIANMGKPADKVSLRLMIAA